MTSQAILAIIFCILFTVVMGKAFIEATARQFKNNPAESTYQGDTLRKKASQIADDTNERQRLMMEKIKSRTEQNKF